jgi:hypothetical protein
MHVLSVSSRSLSGCLCLGYVSVCSVSLPPPSPYLPLSLSLSLSYVLPIRLREIPTQWAFLSNLWASWLSTRRNDRRCRSVHDSEGRYLESESQFLLLPQSFPSVYLLSFSSVPPLTAVPQISTCEIAFNSNQYVVPPTKLLLETIGKFSLCKEADPVAMISSPV